MNKKIIAVLLIGTILFMGTFAACNKENEDGDDHEVVIYAENKDINFVTDENGEKVLDSDGRIIVYATEEGGKKIKDKDGQYVTQAQEFQPIEDDGVVEDLGFIFELPDGWKTTKKFGEFTNKDGTQKLEITIMEQFYEDYYKTVKGDYDEVNEDPEKYKGITVTWEEELDWGTDFRGLCRFTLATDQGMIVMYVFENSRNLYKVRYVVDGDTSTAVADSEALLKSITFKPYAYYTDITAKTTETTKAAAPMAQ